jgi:hypothetical protein
MGGGFLAASDRRYRRKKAEARKAEQAITGAALAEAAT